MASDGRSDLPNTAQGFTASAGIPRCVHTGTRCVGRLNAVPLGVSAIHVLISAKMKAFIVKLFKTSEDVACGQMQIATNQRHSGQTSAGTDEPCSRSQSASVGTILRARMQQSLQILPDSQRSRSTLHCITHLHNAIKQ